MHERKKNKDDPIANPIYFFRNPNEKNNIDNTTNKAAKLISLKTLNERLKNLNEEEKNKMLLGETVYKTIKEERENKPRPKSSLYPLVKTNKKNLGYIEYEPEKYIKMHNLNRFGDGNYIINEHKKNKDKKNKTKKTDNNSKSSFNQEVNLKLNNSINIKSLYTKKLKQSSSAKSVNFIPNEFKSLDNITDRNNKNINILMNKLTPITSPSLINKSQNSAFNNIFSPLAKSISLPSDIIHKSFLGFEESITSYYSEFSPPIKSIIKGYAYNSNKGNIRNYNEDTICVKKINSKIEQIFYFFGIFDGHGGKGCASFLQENLYKYIQNFSSESLEKAIYQSENDFLSNYAVDINNNLKDTSGSCGVMAMIKNNKLIIANIGDSRIVLFKNGKLFFETEDHKPNSEKEKERIKNSGGQIYQSQSLIPIYQKINLPWRVLPGRLSVSRTFGDIQAKTEKFGGKSGVIIPVPDMTEFDLDESFDFMVIGCDGIFDVISNEQIFDIWKIVLNEQRYKDLENDELDINVLCGDFADAIIKSSLFKNSYDNLSCIVVVFNLNKYNFDMN